jgi:hypothetical protein
MLKRPRIYFSFRGNYHWLLCNLNWWDLRLLKWITHWFVGGTSCGYTTTNLGQGYAKMIMKHIEDFAINNTIIV